MSFCNYLGYIMIENEKNKYQNNENWKPIDSPEQLLKCT